MQIIAIIKAINDLLKPQDFNDYAPNGLQITGADEVSHIVTGVTACQRLIKAAVAKKAQMLLVHHGYFWANENPILTGIKQQRIKTILLNDINLVAYHLPLDAHFELGNNVQLAKRLNIKINGVFDNKYVFYGEFTTPIVAEQLQQKIATILNRQPLLIKANNRLIKSVVWCTGGAQKYIQAAANFGADAFLTGEISESSTHIARETGVNFFACGHHATERYGIKALGDYLAARYSLKHSFVDIDNPV